VDPKSREELPDLTVGEIWTDSPSKALGYYGLPEESEATFRAKIANSNADKTYLRMGDLGFFYNGICT
jgi:acyl-CoA synthetase (AMP-forming)/AMP-acid ligase II